MLRWINPTMPQLRVFLSLYMQWCTATSSGMTTSQPARQEPGGTVNRVPGIWTIPLHPEVAVVSQIIATVHSCISV